MTTGTTLQGDNKLGMGDVAVLRVLVERAGRVTGRHDLNRLAGFDGTARRCEVALVAIRRVLGAEAIVTVRRRGWMLDAQAVETAAALVESHT